MKNKTTFFPLDLVEVHVAFLFPFFYPHISFNRFYTFICVNNSFYRHFSIWLKAKKTSKNIFAQIWNFVLKWMKDRPHQMKMLFGCNENNKKCKNDCTLYELSHDCNFECIKWFLFRNFISLNNCLRKINISIRSYRLLFMIENDCHFLFIKTFDFNQKSKLKM